MALIISVFQSYALIFAFALIGAVMGLSYLICDKLFKGRIHGSALAIFVGLVMAYIGGAYTGGNNGFSDVATFSGLAIMGGRHAT